MSDLANNHKLLEINDVHYTYPPPREIHALRGVNLSVKQGEFVCIAGQNGSGKSTLAKMISGYIAPTKGELKIQGKNPRRMSARERVKYVSYVFQNPDHQLFKESVWEDVAFSLKNIKMDPKQIEEDVEKVLKQLELWDKRYIHPFRLAKGDRQRLAIGCIIVLKPMIVVVDEPNTGQDPVKSREIMDLLRELNKAEGTTIITITHSMELIAEYAERVIVFAKGEVLLDDSPRVAFAQEDLLAQAYLAPPQITRLGIRLGLNPLPLTVYEAKEAFLKELAK